MDSKTDTTSTWTLLTTFDDNSIFNLFMVFSLMENNFNAQKTFGMFQ